MVQQPLYVFKLYGITVLFNGGQQKHFNDFTYPA